ncbi:outer membrane beta-barrel protein [Neolewinella antarctica]|uniref:Opacity protein-like surface antigen n=1 Tax=Neolewinella antarctica TaxID=442734 RepID=A0ABX0XC40_9BACT|nr:outer membrane beta-barrel protein [Neolewinella antarctica]NJC26503.1 opacity protein-like surface antigen [Neolewinella antarctica]
MRILYTLLLTTLLCTCASAQGFSGGFRAGLNFITKSGPLEMSPDGTDIYETANRTTGFHIGATFAYEITDLVGVKADLMYSQKGSELTYAGPSYFYIYDSREDVEGEIFFGDLNGELDIVNSYIDIPFTAYYKLGNLEIEGGFSAGLLINSRVTGGLRYTNVDPFPGSEFIFSVNGNYLSDEAGARSVTNVTDNPISGSTFEPDGIGAYYNSTSDENRFNRLEFGLIAGLAYYLNNGLYVGARYQYGLSDITSDENDQRVTVDTDNPGRSFTNDDEDYTRSIQVSVGFRF